MLGVSGLMGSSDAAAEAHESGGASGGSSEVGGSSSIPGGGALEESGGGGGGGGGGAGNRWPRQETLALLKIRSEMDVAFRDASLKGPLWEEVSRKMAELGFQRSAKKCKEKFENVFKYHKRTKDGRASKSDGKTYRFFDQLEALENTPPNPFTPPAPRRPVPTPENAGNINVPPPSHHVTVSSTTSPTPLSVVFPNIAPQTTTTPFPPPLQQSPPQTTTTTTTINTSMNHPSQIHHHQIMSTHPHISTSLLSNSTSSSTSSDEDIQLRRGRKRKWKDYFERLMRDVIHKQEDLQRKFLEALEKRERDRMAREEVWRSQEMARMNREHDLLVQERSIAAAKDAAVITFLQKIADQHNLQIPIGNNIAPPIPPPQMQVQPPPAIPHQQQKQQPQQQQPPPPPPQQQQQSTTVQPRPEQPQPPPVLMETQKSDNGGDHFLQPSSSRWPKAEVQALINLRTRLDIKYQENGPKGPLWEEISAAMAKLGYNRSSKRCKEKWENINKYYKKVKESNKKRPEDSKTCPYFHQLEAIYKERAKSEAPFNPNPAIAAPIMAMPEQQWPLPQQQQQQQQQQQNQDSIMHDRDHDNESDNINDHEDDDEEDDDDEDEGGNYEIIANKQPSPLTNAAE